MPQPGDGVPLYGLAEAAVLAAGYAPAIGFPAHRQTAVLRVRRGGRLQIRDGGALSPCALPVRPSAVGSAPGSDAVGEVRRGCRDAFRKTHLLQRLIPGIEEMLAAGGVDRPEPHPEAQPVAIPERPSGDVGHRG